MSLFDEYYDEYNTHVNITADCTAELLSADAADTENPELSIELVTQTIRRPNGVTISFEVDAFRKKCLLEGLDDIGLTMEKSRLIDDFEANRTQQQPWL